MYRLLCTALLAVVTLAGCTQTPARPDGNSATLRPLATGTSYYVDSSGGNDANNGSSASTPWETLTKVNGFTFQPGDELLFKAGGVWAGQLYPKGSGNSANVITIDQYGTGSKPRFDGQGAVSDTVYLENQEYWDINNIEVTNDSATASSRNGIRVGNSSGGVLNHIHIKNTYVHNVKNFVNGNYDKNAGIAVLSDVMTSKWNDVLIDSNTVSTIERIGVYVGVTGKPGADIRTFEAGAAKTTGVIISNNALSDLGGDGILAFVTDGARIIRNTINGHAKRQNTTCLEVGSCNIYSVGIWIAAAPNSTIEENEVYGGIGTLDGQAYDIDWGSDNAKVQYNYSHDNAGGFLLIITEAVVGTGNPDNENAVVRYNISQNDGRGVYFINDALNAINKIQIYNNVFYIPSGKTVNLLTRQNGQPFQQSFFFSNNIIYNLGTAIYGGGAGVYANNVFYGNHDPSEPSEPNKVTSDPLFSNPGSGGLGRGSLDGYKLATGSPALYSGALIANNGGRDFWGTTLPMGGAPSRGAYQIAGAPGGTGNGLTVLDDTDTSITYGGAWGAANGLNQATWISGTSHYSNSTGASAQYTCSSCQEILWSATKSPDAGIVNVYVDGTLTTKIDMYASSREASRTRFGTGVFGSVGQHTLKLEVSGMKNSSASDMYLELDAFQTASAPTVIDDVNASVTYSGTFGSSSGLDQSTWVNGTSHYSNSTGAYAQYGCSSCREIVWNATKSPDQGIAKLYVDGVFVTTLDLYSSVRESSRVRFGTGVFGSPGAHTLRVEVSGTKNVSASDTYIEIDAFQSLP